MSELYDLSYELADKGMEWQIPMAGKRPGIKGLGYPGTADPAELAEHFEVSHIDGVAVAMLPNALLGYDIDPADCTPEQWERADAWIQEHLQPLIEAGAWVQHSMRDEGYHVVLSHPGEGVYIPAQIMPGITMRNRNYIRIYDTSQMKTFIADLPVPPVEAYTQVEGMSGRRGGSGVAEWDAAVEVLRTDGKTGGRHDAVNSLALHIMRQNPDLGLEDAARELVSLIEEVMPASRRRDELCEIAFEPDSEIVRCFRPLMPGGQKRNIVQGGDVAQERLANLLAEKFAGVTPFVDQERAAVINKKIREEERITTAIESTTGWASISTNGQIEASHQPSIQWIVENLIPERNLIGLAGPSGAGKTRWVSALVAALSAGATDAMGLPPCNPTKVLYIANEERVSDVYRRIKAACRSLAIGDGLEHHIKGKNSGLLRLIEGEEENEEEIDRIIAYVAGYGIKVVIFDPFVTLGAEDENSAADVSRLIRIMQRIIETTGAAVMFVHHTPKGNEAEDMRGDSSAFRGSGGIYSALDLAVTLFPYVPSSFYAPQKGKGMRRRLRDAIARGEVAKHIVLDPAKERENIPLPPLIHRLDSVAVNEDDQMIGAISEPRSASLVDVELTEAVSGTEDLAEKLGGSEKSGGDWLSRLLKAYGHGRHLLSLDHLNEVMKGADWKPATRWDRGQAHVLKEALKAVVRRDGNTFQIIKDGAGNNTVYRLIIGSETVDT